jgi:BolA protein
MGMDKHNVNPLPREAMADRTTDTGTMEQEMRALLTDALQPTRLDISNDSAKHRGHSGDDGSGESHFTIMIESAAFEGQSRLARQRAVIAALGDIPGDRVHALAIKARAPGEGA